MQCVVAVFRKQRYVPGLSSLRQPIRGIGKHKTPFEDPFDPQTLLICRYGFAVACSVTSSPD